MDRTEQHKKAMIEALKKSLGVVTDACKMAGVGRTQFYSWLKDDPEFNRNVESINEESLDFAETKLFELIRGVVLPEDKIFVHKGKTITVPTMRTYPPDTASVIFYLKTKGKKRGYVEKQEIEHSGRIQTAQDLTDEDLARIATGN